MRRVAAITGARSDYGVMRSVVGAIIDHAGLELELIVTGAHLSPDHGMTVREIEGDGYRVGAMVPIVEQDTTESDLGVAQAMGRGVSRLAESLSEIEPDVALVLGDRYETFAGALAAATLRLPIAHIGGGECDQATCLDGYLRNALTQFAHVHFVSCEAYAERVIAMGQEPWRVHVVGLPSLDGITDDLASRSALAGELGLDLGEPLIVGTYLPVTLRPDETRAELAALLEALGGFPQATLVLTLSNADAGGRAVNEAVRAFAADRSNVHAFESLGARRYRSLLAIADAVVGNSSSGIIETPSFGVPTVNVGARQEGRLRAENILDVPGDAGAIRDAIERCLSDDDFRDRAGRAVNPFGDGKAGERIAAVLAELSIDRRLLEKRIPPSYAASPP